MNHQFYLTTVINVTTITTFTTDITVITVTSNITVSTATTATFNTLSCHQEDLNSVKGNFFTKGVRQAERPTKN